MLGFCRVLVLVVIIKMGFGFWVELGEATGVARERNCGQAETCLEVYRREKNTWLECLKQAGVSKKKRAILAEKTERLGIRNLKKTEFLIFNSQRKDCHKTFSRAISGLKKDSENTRRWPVPMDRFERFAPGETRLKKP